MKIDVREILDTVIKGIEDDSLDKNYFKMYELIELSSYMNGVHNFVIVRYCKETSKFLGNSSFEKKLMIFNKCDINDIVSWTEHNIKKFASSMGFK